MRRFDYNIKVNPPDDNIYDGGQLRTVNVTSKPMPFYKKWWRKFDRNVLKYPKFAIDYFFPTKGGFYTSNDVDFNRIESSNDESNDYVFSNEFIEKNNNTVRKAKDFKNTQDTLLGDKKINLDNISNFYGVENGKLKSGDINSFDDDTYVVPNRHKKTGKVKEILEFDEKVPPREEYKKELNKIHKTIADSHKDEYNDYVNTIRNSNGGRKPSDERLMRDFAKRYPEQEKELSKGNKIIESTLADAKNHPIRKGFFGVTENNDTVPIQNTGLKMMFSNEKGNTAFVSGMKQNREKLNEFLKENPSYPVMLDNGRYSHYRKDGDVNAYMAIGEKPENTYVIGAKKKAYGGKLNKGYNPYILNLNF